MKFTIFVTIVSCVAAMADIMPENQVEGKEITLVRIPRRYRFRVSFRRKFNKKTTDAAYSNNPYGIVMGNRRIGLSTTTTPEPVETTADVGLRYEDATTLFARDDVNTELPTDLTARVEAPADALVDDWKRTDNGEFKFYKTGATWDEARAICEADGGFLLVLNNDAHKEDLLNFLKDPQDMSATDASWMYYLGYSGTNGEFQITPYGAPASATGYDPWCTGSPATVADPKCGVLDDNCKGLIEVNCSLKLAFFCSRF